MDLFLRPLKGIKNKLKPVLRWRGKKDDRAKGLRLTAFNSELFFCYKFLLSVFESEKSVTEQLYLKENTKINYFSQVSVLFICESKVFSYVLPSENKGNRNDVMFSLFVKIFAK